MPIDNFVDYSGCSIDDYQVDKLLVRHQESARYLGHDSSGQPIFIEILNSTNEQAPNLNGRHQQQINTLIKHPHPSIASILYVGHTANNHAYTVSQCGVTLAQKLDEWDRMGIALSILDALRLVKSLAQAFAIVHPLEIFHHDLRPDNIILEKDNIPVLMGLDVPYQAKQTHPANQVSQLDYASPEQQQGKPINGRSNIFSLGVILYELLAGHQPEIPLYPIHTSEISTLPKEIPLNKDRLGLMAETYKLVSTCLERQEKDRYETIDQFILAIDEAIAAETTQIQIARFTKWLYFIVPFGLLLIAGISFLFFKGNQETSATKSLSTTMVQTHVPYFQTMQPDQTVTLTTQAIVIPDETVQSTLNTKPQILALNPASGSVLTNTEPINFEWYYPPPLKTDQQFLLQVTTNTGNQILGTVNTPQSGSRYQLTINLADWESISGNHQWFVVLETISSGEEIQRSEPQPFTVQTIVLVTTPTPKLTQTFLPTLTPEIPAERPSETPAAVCTPVPPSGWVLYIIGDGDYLFNLAMATGTTVERLQEVNCLVATGLGVGQRIWLPVLPPTATPTITPISTPESSGNGSNSEKPDPTKTPPPPP